jgi:hypothetical protein
MNVSDRVVLNVRVLIVSVLLLGIISGYYVPALETKVSIISAVLTSATLLYVLSENLRASAVRKLDYWNKKVLTPLLSLSNQLIQFESPRRAETLSQYRNLLKRWGKIGFVKLYPKGFLSTLEVMKEHTVNYDQLYNTIRTKGEKFVGSSYHHVSLFYALGIGEGGNATADIIVKHKEFLDGLKKEDPKLLDQFQTAISSVQSDMARLKADIETFFIENQLEPVKETTSFQPLGPFSLFQT